MRGSHESGETLQPEDADASDPDGSVGETDRDRATDPRIRELERENERLSELLDVLGHDLRNHLAVAKGRLELAREGRDDDDLASVARSHDRVEELLDDLLDARDDGFTVGDGEPVSLEACARRAWRTVQAGNAELAVESDLEFRADPRRLTQLLENLFHNAVEHGTTSPDSWARRDAVEHGAIRAELSLTVTVGPLSDGTGFYVADDGRGLPASGRERVFDEGFTTAEDGTGLGLAIVSDVVSGHDWTIQATESSAGGARFEIAGVDPAVSTTDARSLE